MVSVKELVSDTSPVRYPAMNIDIAVQENPCDVQHNEGGQNGVSYRVSLVSKSRALSYISLKIRSSYY
jgi:hypothetical protein